LAALVKIADGETMFILLSSGASPRYRQDILRAIAIPKGGRLQFRYDSKWIEAKVRDLLSKNGARGTPALIVYIDQHDKTKVTELIPCRFATVVDVLCHGSTVSVILALEEIGHAEGLAAFNNELKSMCSTLPTWRPKGSISGTYWFDISQEPKTVARSTTLATWERIVEQIAERPDFADESFFYKVEGFYQIGRESSQSHERGIYELAAGREYELRIYHFHPKRAPEQTRLRLATASKSLEFTTNPQLNLDSRYDMKRARFKAGRPSKTENSVLSVYRVTSDRQDALGTWEIDLPFRINGSFWNTLGYGVLLGVLLAGPQVVAALSNPNLPASNVTAISIVSALLGLGAGIVAAFGLKRSV
jgi:hypothetical protein